MAGAGYDISVALSSSSAAHNASPFSNTDSSSGGFSPLLIGGLVALGLVGLVVWFKLKGGN